MRYLMYDQFSGNNSIVIVDGRTVKLFEEEENCSIPQLPKAGSDRPVLFQHGKDVLLCGGLRYKKDCIKLDHSKKKWTNYNSLHIACLYSTAVAIKDAVYVLGGDEGYGLPTANEMLKHDKTKWKEKKAVPFDLDGGCGVKISDNEFVVIGGDSRSGPDYIRKIRKFNTIKNKWHNPGIELHQGRYLHACAKFKNKIIIIGGQTEKDGHQLGSNSTEIIDISEEGDLSIRLGQPMNIRRKRHAAHVVIWDNVPTLIVFGNDYHPENIEDKGEVEVWNDYSETWNTLSNMTWKSDQYVFSSAIIPKELICP